ncbi:uncharacterized protein LOC114253691 [Rhopalosiphum maidis]|uniref:uncharacterized protein LOC114253691 n=1 Tax=Rhopalosiphum maidis TaxID=43146 RepID=UPI00101C6E15|nr:uncharacterized protein LOC114253691 [Rhopalosiphum maidis]
MFIYEKWVIYINNYWSRKELWYLAFRDTTVHGNQTNNFSEVSVRLFKDIVLSRNKAYNAIALVDFIFTGIEDYYLRRSDCGYYEVDVTHGFCICSKENLRAFCKHQAAVYHHHNESMPNLPAITLYMLAKLAFGENVPERSFYKPPHFEKYNCHFSEKAAEIVEYNESLLSTAGSSILLRHRSRATIQVEPTMVSRRKPGITRGNKRLLVGRPAKIDNNKRNAIKRKRNLAENVKRNVPNAKSH